MGGENKVLIVMGSDSDLPVMKDCGTALQEFEIAYQLTISSAHRCPWETARLAAEAEDGGFKVIVAGAGGAAHLPGVIAAHTLLPVIGVPILSSSLAGADSLYSIVQMPRGIPVATVAINGAYNAGLLAVQMMSLQDKTLRDKMNTYRGKLKEKVMDKNQELEKKGLEGYLQEKNYGQ